MTDAAESHLAGGSARPWSAPSDSARSDSARSDSARSDSAPAVLVPQVRGWVLFSSALIPLLLMTAWLIADALQPPSYSPVRQTVSVLSGYAGAYRWIVTTALYVIGVAYLLTAVGARGFAAPARAGLAIAGIAAVGVAAFPEPAHGTSQQHAFFTGIGAVAIAVWPAVVARQESVWTAVGARWTLGAIITSFALLVWTAAETRNGAWLGLAERVSSAAQACWPFVVMFQIHRAQAMSVQQDATRRLDGRTR